MPKPKQLFFLFFLLLLSFTPLFAGPVEDVAKTPRDSAPKLQPSGELMLFPLSDEYIVIAGLYNEYWDERFRNEFRTRLSRADQLEATPSKAAMVLAKAGLSPEQIRTKLRDKVRELPEWSLRFFYNFATAELMAESLPQIRDHFQDPSYFSIVVNGKQAKIAAHGYWINAVGVKRMPRFTQPGTMLTNSGELIPFAYLKLAIPLRNGDKLQIKSKVGESLDFTYDDTRHISRAIKVNQEGYAREAGRKYAYLGMWLGELGAMPLEQRVGSDFHLRNRNDGSIAYSGKLQLRGKDITVNRNKIDMPLTGETVLEMDFSQFNTPGEYYIQIPGVGRSWDFLIGDNAVGRAFYVQMRGLFHQRSGVAKERRYTRWNMKEDHKISYRGGFVPNDRHYSGKGSRFFDKNGKQISIRHFDMVRATATEEELPEVYGGWWDAGDFDRRTYHFAVVDALLSVYLLFPEKFRDGQLDIPESGNGIPDIVDEAAWGVDVWRRAQNAAGGVGCWLEATSHPVDPDPETDTQRYYLALPTRESTLEYCAYAAKLARAYRHSGDQAKAKLFTESAERAWAFALNPANTLKTEFTHPRFGILRYTEPQELEPMNLFKAAFNLYMLTQSETYAQAIDPLDYRKVINKARNEKNAYFLSELVETHHPFAKQSVEYRKMIRKRADELLASQDELAYRNINWPLKSPYFTFLGWGAGLPFNKGSFLIMAWRIDGKAQYRDAAYLCFDWMLGANPMGRSMTTGLGKIYPIRLLSLPMWAWRDRLVDPIPGLTPYMFDGRNNYAATDMIYHYIKKPRKDHLYGGCEINLLPKSLWGEQKADRQRCFRILQQTIPLWRRFANVEGYAVSQNEFSVWETIAPAAAGYAALLPDNWMPPAEWKQKEPETSLKNLPGYIFLP